MWRICPAERMTRKPARPLPSCFLNRLFNNSGEPAPRRRAPAEERQPPGEKEGKTQNGKRKFLEGYCISLNRKAKEGKLDPVIGRAEEIERVIQILNRRQKNNPCLIGEPGVGKTAIAEGLAQRIVAGMCPSSCGIKRSILDLTALVAGTQFRGQFEQRMKGLIDEVKRLGNIILMIDEVHNIVGAGDAEGSMNAANILKPALPGARSRSSAPPPSMNTASPSRRTAPWSAGSSR